MGIYFLILLLAMGDIERNPGPNPELIETLSKLLDEKLKVTNDAIGDQRGVVEGFGDQLNEIKTEVEELRAEKNELANHVVQLEKRLAVQESESSRRNMVIFGIPSNVTLEQALEDVLFKHLELEKRPQEQLVESAFRTGRPDGRVRPIVVRFVSQEYKDTRVLGWVEKYKKPGVLHHDDDADESESASARAADRPVNKRKKRNRAAAQLSPEELHGPLEPQAGPSHSGFATAPLKQPDQSQTKAVGNPRRGRSARSIERLKITDEAATSSGQSDGE
ncbi:Hypothetical predicted protein [Cloeon dipterum]|uniref:Uncharacterized protein n=1 Tax=Cloeon dipterum TaxID=197152 RepID=A0A8S1DLN4_9INSE|nr:Hypothetical predicted protein [Cloeon dipterum]